MVVDSYDVDIKKILLVKELTRKINQHPLKNGSDYDELLIERSEIVWKIIFNRMLLKINNVPDEDIEYERKHAIS
jgi:hypothetical protein